MIELVAAGIEGGRKRLIEEEWGLPDVVEIRRYWRANGPPLIIAAAALASYLGMKLTGDEPEPSAPEELDVPVGAPRLADLTDAIPMPGHGGDTLAASRAILERLNREKT